MSIIDLDCSTTYDRWDVPRWYLTATCEGRQAQMTVSKALVNAFPELMKTYTERMIDEVRPPADGGNVRGGEKELVAKLLKLVHGGAGHEDVYVAVRDYYLNGASE